jgi:hypothetical protein
MPNFLFRCPHGHENELLRHRDTVEVACGCGATARRAEVNRIAVTGFAETPRGQENYRREFADFKEASAEVDYAYTKAESDGMPVRRPNLYKAGLRKAQREGAKIRSV